MTWHLTLYLGIAIWWAAHLFKRLDPAHREAMEKRLGKAARGVIATLILISVALMIIGYRGTEAGTVYTPPDWGPYANNLLMLVAVILFGLGSSRSRARSWLRHPMLTGCFVWAFAHLLANGDSASVALFGLLGMWAIVEILVINRAEPNWERFQGGSVGGDVRLLLIAAVAFTVIASVHVWIGPNPFAG